MAACTDVRYDTAGAAYQSLLEADASRRPPRLHPCLDCRGWHLTARRVTRAQWLSRRRQGAAEQAETPDGESSVVRS
jgi:hypothetical protein